MTSRRSSLRASLGNSISYLAAGFLLACPAVAAARPDLEASSPVTVVDRETLESLPSRTVSDILDSVPKSLGNVYVRHNEIRGQFGSPDLLVNPQLAAETQAFADMLARSGSAQHASRSERGDVSENLSFGRRGDSAERLFDIWANEQDFFTPGTFPNICGDLDWSACGHLTNMIWFQSTEMGCGYASDRISVLVCRYWPQGNTFGQLVLGPGPNVLADGRAIDLNGPQPTDDGTRITLEGTRISRPPRYTLAPPVLVETESETLVSDKDAELFAKADEASCTVPEPDDFIKLLNQAAVKSGLGIGGLDPSDMTTQRQWGLALDREQDVQDRMMKELATLQGDVATHINAYLAATSAWQELYVHIASSSTGLQGLLTNWLEARGIYEKADLAFALANLGVGGVKLGFKAYKFFTAPRAAAGVADDAAAGATRLAGAADDAAAGAGRVAGGADEAATAVAGATDEAAALATGETQAFNRTLVPPGSTSPTGRAIPGRNEAGLNLGANPNAPGFRGYTGTSSASGPVGGASAASGASSAAGVSADAAAAYARAVAEAEQKLAAAKAAGQFMDIEVYQYQLSNLLRQGANGYAAERAAALARKIADVDPRLAEAARQAGVNVENVVSATADAHAADTALMRAIAAARGWHDIPAWADAPIQNVLLQARKILAGADDVRIPPQQLEIIKSLRTYVESRGLNFADWLRKAAGEIEDGIVAGETVTSSAIVRYFDEADISLLLRILDAGGDATKLRATVTPVAQASLNGLGRAAQAAGGGCGALDAGLGLQGVGGTLAGAGNGGGTPASTAPGGAPTNAQLENVLYGTGELGKVGLGNVVDQFGVTDRFTAGQSLPRAMLGELWELITSPSATVASHYYTHVAQGEYLDLLKNEHNRLVDLGLRLTDAARALKNLQNTLQRAGLSGPGSYLGSKGPADLRRALSELDRIYNSGSEDWKKNHKSELDARRDHITQKLAALAETVDDLAALTARMQNVRNWLDSLRMAPGGGLRSGVDLFDPQVFVRLGSISLYLRGMGADAFGLTSDTPFRVVAAPPNAPAAQPQPASATPAEVNTDDIDAAFERARAVHEERIRQIDEAPETHVDTDFDAWLNSLPPGE
jgi:hypothetical protein